MKSTNLTGKNHNRILSLPTRFESRIRKIPRHAFIKRYTFLLNRKRKTEEEEKSKKEKENFHFENVIIERIHGSKGRIGERVVRGQEPGQSNYCATRRLTSFFFSSLSLSLWERPARCSMISRGGITAGIYNNVGIFVAGDGLGVNRRTGRNCEWPGPWHFFLSGLPILPLPSGHPN